MFYGNIRTAPPPRLVGADDGAGSFSGRFIDSGPWFPHTTQKTTGIPVGLEQLFDALAQASIGAARLLKKTGQSIGAFAFQCCQKDRLGIGLGFAHGCPRFTMPRLLRNPP